MTNFDEALKQETNCKNCGAVLDFDLGKCEYCGTHIFKPNNIRYEGFICTTTGSVYNPNWIPDVRPLHSMITTT